MSAKLQDAYNDQITLEFASSYAYLQMAAFLDDANLPGFANWMRQQAEEERVHAMKFFDFCARPRQSGRTSLDSCAVQRLHLAPVSL